MTTLFQKGDITNYKRFLLCQCLPLLPTKRNNIDINLPPGIKHSRPPIKNTKLCIPEIICEPFTKRSQILTTLYKTYFDKTVKKGENDGKQHFLLFSQYFLHVEKQISIFQ